MPRQPIDPKRSGIKASLIEWAEPPMYLENHRWHGPLGAFLEREGIGLPRNWLLCCPGCGELGAPKDTASWTAPLGSFADVTTLTLRPSILKDCCGWHGYLTHGVFELECKSV